MNLLNNEEDDLVSAWFNSSGIPRPVLTRRAFFQFAPGCLAVASNSESFIENISDRLRHYQIDKGKINKEVIEAEIYYLGGCPTIRNKTRMQGTGEYEIRPYKRSRAARRGEPCVHPEFSDSLLVT